MDPMEAENLLKKLDRRVQNVEQILPTLATKEELQAAVAKLATKEELQAAVAKLATKEELAAAIAPLATRAELAAESERMRRHFDVLAERIHDDVRIIAEGHVGLEAKVRRERKDVEQILAGHNKRLTRLEAAEARRRRKKGG